MVGLAVSVKRWARTLWLTQLRVACYAMFAVVGIACQAQAAEVWHVKCFAADGHTLAVKALSAQSDAYDVKAFATQDPAFHDVKALHPETGEQLPIKVVASHDQEAIFSDVKAIENGDQLIAVKAITGYGEILSIKAFHNDAAGRYDIKCLGGDGEMLGLKAISPSGRVYDVKGIKELPDQEDLGIEVLAHIKAIPQAD
ncbi:MAG: hypothetical protein Kilf2KO_44120 [Rhodospirillales bacterium]